MESSEPSRRFPPPWGVSQDAHGYIVKDANGVTLARVYSRDDYHQNDWSFSFQHLTSDEARRIAKAIARLPDLLRPYPEFRARRSGWPQHKWRPSHPYHVALQDAYVRESYDEIVECCRANGIPFDATGEKMRTHGIYWIIYEFARQIDAIQFWRVFEGRWLLGENFYFPNEPKDVPPLKYPPVWSKKSSDQRR